MRADPVRLIRRAVIRAVAVAAVLAICLFWAGATRAADYAPLFESMEVELVDSSDSESFLAVAPHPSGKLFAGGREALFVYEPNEEGGFGKRVELFRFPPDTWIYDIVTRGNDVYALTVSALYLLPDAVTKRSDIVAKPLVWGVPMGHVHQCFHGMAIGPEGDIYFAMGDPVWYYGNFDRPDHWGHWTFFSQPEGTGTPYNGVGGVFRCRPDGTHFQVVARGLRNSCGLCFDRHWNLFSNDNDHEQMPGLYVPARLIHVTGHSYFNWPRGWFRSKFPDREDILETMFEGMGRAVPVGQGWYGDEMFREELDDDLLVCRWGIRSVTHYPLAHRGASFEVTEGHVLDGVNQARPVGIGIGHGGAIYVTIAYMAQNEASPIYRSDLVKLRRKRAAGGLGEGAYSPFDVVGARADELFSLLRDKSWSTQLAAHQELLRRGDAVHIRSLQEFGAAMPDDPAMENLIWLAASTKDAQAREKILEIGTQSENSQVALQATRAVAEYWPGNGSLSFFETQLKHSDPQVRHAALLGLFTCDGPLALNAIAQSLVSPDSYLRQAATLLVAERGSVSQILGLVNADSAELRLAGILACGFRLTLPPATSRLDRRLVLDKLRNEEANFVQFPDRRVDLREKGPIGNFTIADHWNSGIRTAEQDLLFEVLRQGLADGEEKVRLQAVHFLSVLSDPRTEGDIQKVITATELRRLASIPAKGVPAFWIAGPFDDGSRGFATIHPPQLSPIELAAKYPPAEGADPSVEWQKIESGFFINIAKILAAPANSSSYCYFRLDSAVNQNIQLLVGSDDGVMVWINGKEVWINDVSRGALPFQDAFMVPLTSGSNEVLIRVQNREGESGAYVHFKSLSEVIASAPDKLDIASLAERLAAAAADGSKNAVPKEFLQVNWEEELQNGSAENGKKVFQAAGCVKCHATEEFPNVVGGPSLMGAGKRFTLAHLVESILLPNAQISPIFRATQVVLKDGTQQTGLVLGESAEKIELILPDTKKVEILKSEIEERALQNLSPMPQGILKKPEELRDILKFILSAKGN